MHVRKYRWESFARRISCIGVTMLCGCGTLFIPTGTGSLPSTLNLTALGIDPSIIYYESDTNNVFESADLIPLNEHLRWATPLLAIQGRISGTNDVDVYNLGPVEPGDRIVVDVTSSDSLDGAIALFDDHTSSLLVNDHRNVYLGRREPFVDVVIRRSSDACYVALSSTPGFDTSGEYVLIATRQPSTPLPEPRPDTILLDFSGGENIRIGSRPAINVPPFDASSISSEFQGLTGSMIAVIVEAVSNDFTGLEVTILSTSEGAVYDGNMTRIFFGTLDQSLLGVAEGIDEFNSDTRQVAIVFTDTFSAFMRANPTLRQMSQAIANVASHEIGHLLGLVHTEDPGGIMDVTASIRRLLEDQSFTRSPIYSAVYPIGNQDSVQTLLDTVGGDASLMLSKYPPIARWFYDDQDDDAPPARNRLFLSTCGIEEP